MIYSLKAIKKLGTTMEKTKKQVVQLPEEVAIITDEEVTDREPMNGEAREGEAMDGAEATDGTEAIDGAEATDRAEVTDGADEAAMDGVDVVNSISTSITTRTSP